MFSSRVNIISLLGRTGDYEIIFLAIIYIQPFSLGSILPNLLYSRSRSWRSNEEDGWDV